MPANDAVAGIRQPATNSLIGAANLRLSRDRFSKGVGAPATSQNRTLMR